MTDLHATRKALVTEIDELEFRHRGDLNPLTADERERLRKFRDAWCSLAGECG